MSQAETFGQARLYELDLRAECWRRLRRRELVPFAVRALMPKGETPAKHHHRILRRA